MDSSLTRLRRVGTAAGLTGVAVMLQWTTAGTLDRASTTDLESMAALVFAGVAWTAYLWLAVAIAATLLGQLPGAFGRAASSVAVGITSDSSRRLLRTVLGVAAAAPLTIGVANAASVSSDGNTAAHVVQHSNPPQPIEHDPTAPRAESSQRSWAGIEHPSTVTLTRPREDRRAAPERPAAPVRPWGRAHVERPSAINLVASGRTESDRIPIPDRPTVGTPTRYADIGPAKRSKPQPSARSPIRITVRLGDTLWEIAARELGPKAANTAIAKRWPQWYAANSRVIGADPDLLLPGQTLRIPGQSRTEHRLPISRINQEN